MRISIASFLIAEVRYENPRIYEGSAPWKQRFFWWPNVEDRRLQVA